MLKKIKSIIILSFVLTVVGCATTNSNSYKASTNNVITLQNNLKQNNIKVSLGSFALTNGTDDQFTCRMLGPLKVAPGKTIPTYIKEAFQEELFLAQSYDSNSKIVLEAQIDHLAFSSVSPAYWDISMRISSNNSAGYTVAVKYNFDTSWDAFSACKNVADAFAPAVQELLKQVVTNQKFGELVK